MKGTVARLRRVALLVGLAAATPSWAQDERFEEVTTVVVVEVPVQVVHDRQPVRGLTADDFEILDGRKRQPIVGFDVIDLTVSEPLGEQQGITGSVVTLPTSARRHFLLLFDLSFSRPDSIVRARRAAQDLLAEKMHPADLVAVATYSGSKGIQIILGFTSDREQALFAIETLGLAQPLEAVRDPMSLVIADLTSPSMSGVGASGGGGRDADILETARDLQTLTGRAARDQKQNQILALTSSLEELAKLMNSVPGRVNVMLLSEGFDSSVMLGNEGLTNADRDRIAEINRAATSGELWRVDSEERFGSGAALSAMDQMLEELRRADCVVQSIDIGGLRAAGDAANDTAARGSAANRENSLFIMADQTGGEHYRNYNDLGDAMSEMLERTSVTYVLAIQPQDLALDGSYHRLKVKLADGPKGARLVHRPGYYAPKPYAEQTAAERQLVAAGLIMGGQEGGAIGTAVLATPFEVPGEKAYVPVLVEVDGQDLLGTDVEGFLLLEIYAYAVGSNGSISDFFARTLTLDVGKVGDALRQRGFKYWGRLDLHPGDYSIRLLVRNGGTGSTGVRTASVSIQPPGDGAAALLPPLFPEPLGKWIVARDQNVESQAYPFMANGEPFLPAARPVLSSAEASRVCLMVDDPEPVEGLPAVVLIDTDGQAAGEATVELLGSTGQAFPGYECQQATISIPTLPPGEYRLEVTIGDGSAGGTMSSQIPVIIDG